jgi:hypothetical protein
MGKTATDPKLNKPGPILPISKLDMHCGVCGSAVQIIIDHHSVIVTIVKVFISRALHR